MRLPFALGSLVLIGCARSPPEPVQPSAPPAPTAEPEELEPSSSEAPAATPEGDTAAPETPSAPESPDACQRSRSRIVECTKSDSLANATATECKNEFTSAPKPAEELARCLEELGCKALAKSKSTSDGAVGICFIAAKRKLMDPDAP